MNSSLSDLVSSKTFCGILLVVLTLTVIATALLAPSDSPLFEGEFAPFYAAATLLKDPATAPLL